MGREPVRVWLYCGSQIKEAALATSHYCHGKWRSGPVSSCPRHSKLAKKQTNVYKGVGEPGGRSGAPGPPTTEGSSSSE
jgi:hypothetical protein